MGEEHVVGLSSDWDIIPKVVTGCSEIYGKHPSCEMPNITAHSPGKQCDGRVYHVNKYGFVRIL